MQNQVELNVEKSEAKLPYARPQLVKQGRVEDLTHDELKNISCPIDF